MLALNSFAPMVILLAALGCSPQAQTKTFHVDLAGTHEVLPTKSAGTGTADFTFDQANNQLTWRVTSSGLTSEATAAHIHGPARPGDNAGVLVNLAPNGMNNPLEGSAILTDEQASYLLLGRCYVNIHTRQYPAGEIRGQIAP